MTAYVDTSVLLRLILRESGALQDLRTFDALVSSELIAVEGARTTAAMSAGRYAAVLKVSEDGLITFYDRQEKIWDI